MNTEDFRAKYTLLKRLTEDGVTTYTARDVSGRIVMVHFVDDASPGAKDDMQRGIATLTPRDAVKIIERASVGDAAIVVTQYLEGFTTLERWVAEKAQTDAASLGSGDTTQVDLPATVQGQSHQPPAPPSPPRTPNKKPGEFTQTFGKDKPDPSAAETLRFDAVQPPRSPAPTSSAPAEATPPARPREKKAGEFTQLFGQQAADPPAQDHTGPRGDPSRKPLTDATPEPAPSPATPPAPGPEKTPGEFTRMFEPVSPPPTARPPEPTPPASPPPASSQPSASPPSAEPPKKQGAGDFTKMFGAVSDAEQAGSMPPPAAASREPAAPSPPRQPPTKQPGEFTEMFDPVKADQSISPAPVEPRDVPPPQQQAPPPAAKKPGQFTQLFGSTDEPPPGQDAPRPPVSPAGPDPSSERKPKVRWKKRGPAGEPPQAAPSPASQPPPPAPREPSFDYGAPPPPPHAPPDPMFDAPKAPEAPLFGRQPAEKRPGEFTQLFGSSKGGGEQLPSGRMDAGPKPIGRQSMDYLQALSEGMIDPGEPPAPNRPPEPQAPPKPREEMPPVPQGPSEFTKIVSAVPGPPGSAGSGQPPAGAQQPPPGQAPPAMNLGGGQAPAGYPPPGQAAPPQGGAPPMAYAPPPQQAPAQAPQQQASPAAEKKIPVWVWIVVAVVVVLSLALIVWALV